MLSYIIRRLLLIIPTLFGIMVINFAVIQFAPGGPIEQLIAQLEGTDVAATSRITGEGSDTLGQPGQQQGGQIGDEGSRYRGARGLNPKLIADLEKQFGFDKPAYVRFFEMMRDYLMFDFGDSFFKGRPVIDLVLEKMPVSISIGLWTTLIGYLVCIPLGIAKAVRDGSRFDVATTTAVTAASAIPPFILAVLLIVLFAGGRFFSWFPLSGLTSLNWDELSWPARVADYFWHLTLPLIAMVIGSFASMTMLVKNSFLDQINMLYVSTARAKGLSERQVLYGHVFRNAMLIVIAGFPGALVGIFFTGAMLIEIIFSLDGLGLLGFQAAIGRDYPVMFGTLYVFTLIGLIMNLVGDLSYMVVDPRIDFERRDL
jgi:microcin C transport system permease protein